MGDGEKQRAVTPEKGREKERDRERLRKREIERD